MFNIVRSAFLMVVISGSAIASASLLVVQGLPSRDAGDVLEGRALVPMGVDATYTNYDAWVPPGCATDSSGAPIPWTGFRFAHPEPLGCINAIYDGPANPFANPVGGATGVNGTKSIMPGNRSMIDWTNNAAPVTAAVGAARDGHFGYQFSHLSSCTNDAPIALWHRTGGSSTCVLSGTSIQLVPDDSASSLSNLEALQPTNASVIVENLSDRSLEITLAAIEWPDAETYETAATVLLGRLRPEDVLFETYFVGVVPVTENVEPDGQVRFDLHVPLDETVVLARYLVTSFAPERVDEYEAFVAFEALKSERELTPEEPEPATPTPPDVFTPVPTPTPTPPRVFLPFCYR